jgi:hypothetical protein
MDSMKGPKRWQSDEVGLEALEETGPALQFKTFHDFYERGSALRVNLREWRALSTV